MAGVAVRIYVPSVTKNGKKIKKKNHENVVAFLSKNFSHEFGGCTIMRGEGRWLNGNNIMVKEKVTIVESLFSDSGDVINIVDLLTFMAREIKTKMAQESVLFTVNGAPTYV